ncbi:serine/threonine protein kinase [Bacteroides sp. CAG:530]|nr:serine/threonine protein kinase [Bacteroides sp. CAG:530]
MKRSTYSLPVGSTLMQGKYRIVAVLGQGGFGITYKGEHTMLGTTVAIKEFFMKGACERDENSTHVTTSQSNSELASRFRTKFLKEAKTLAALKHPNIIRVFDVFEDNGTAYYVMDYIEGNNLSDIVEGKGRLSEPLALKYIRQVANALDYLHQKKLLHLDVKPANILLDKNTGNAILIDFGVSKQYDQDGQQTSTTPPAISKGYSPVEQYAQGSNVKTFSPATDIYSLAATLYKLVTGNTPPESNLLLNEDEQLPPYPSNVSEVTRNAIAECLQTRKKRPQSISEFLQLLDSEPISNIDTPEEEDTILKSQYKKSQEVLTTPIKTKKDNLNTVFIIGAVIAFVVIIGLLFNKCGGSSSNDSSDEDLDSVVYEPVDTTAVAWDDSTASYEDIYTDDTDNDVSYVSPKNQSNDEITKGSENYEGGSKFVGTFKNGVRLKGTFTWADGDRFEGDFKDGKMSNGVYYYKTGNKFSGSFDSNEERENGTFYWPDGDRFEGDFKNGKISNGVYYYKTGDKFSGSFDSNEKRSYGVYYYTNGDRYEGNFNSNGLKHGSGTYYWKDGDKYEGSWENDKQNGYGVHYNADGSVWFKGQWNNGNPVR